MRTLLTLWLVPMGLMGIWYGLSVNDWNFGTRIFSREMHDMVFRIYGNILGFHPDEVPALLTKAIIFDVALIAVIIAYRMRKKWWPKFSGLWLANVPANDQGRPAE